MEALEFVNLVSQQLGWGTETDVSDLSDEGNKILNITNSVLSAMQQDKNWPELRSVGRIAIVEPETSEALATVAYGDKTIELVSPSDDFFDTDSVGKLIQVGSYTPYYRIDTQTDTLIVETENAWRDEDATLETIVMGDDIYLLPADFDRLLEGTMLNLSTGNTVEEIPPNQMREVKYADGLKLVQQEPRYFTIHGYSTGGLKQVHMDRIGDDNQFLEFDYQINHPILTASTSDILYPNKYNMYIADSVIAMLQRDVENSAQAVQTSNDMLQKAMKAGSNPDNSRDRMRMRATGTPYGAYRRRR
jgi:hypothetical protein